MNTYAWSLLIAGWLLSGSAGAQSASSPLSSSQRVEPFRVKDVPLGAAFNRRQVESRIGPLDCQTNPRGHLMCSGRTTLLGLPASILISVNPQGSLRSMSFELGRQVPATIVDALEKAYGPPKERHGPSVDSLMNGNPDEVRAAWEFTNAGISAGETLTGIMSVTFFARGNTVPLDSSDL